MPRNSRASIGIDHDGDGRYDTVVRTDADFKLAVDTDGDKKPDLKVSLEGNAPKRRMSGKKKLLLAGAALAGAAAVGFGLIGILGAAGVAGAVGILSGVGLTTTTTEEVPGFTLPDNPRGSDPTIIETTEVDNAVLPASAALTGAGAAALAGSGYVATRGSHASRQAARRTAAAAQGAVR